MSYRHLAAVWAAHLEPAGLKLVAATLADRADDDGGSIRFSVATIGRRTSLGGRHVQRCLRRLEDLGVLIVERHSAQHSVTHYRMPLEVLQALATKDNTDPGVTPESPLNNSRGDISDIQGRHFVQPGVTPESPKTSLRRPEASKGRDDAAAPVALPRAVAAPRGVDTSAWDRLIAGRPDLKPEDIADAVAVHLAAGCPAEVLIEAMEVLRVTRHHRSLDPRYRRATSNRKTNAANRGKAATPTPEQERADVVRRLSLVHVHHDTPEQELIRKQFLRVEHSLGLRAEKDRCAERIRREFPEFAPWITWTRSAPTGRWPPTTEEQEAAMLQVLRQEYRAIADRVNAKAKILRDARARKAAS